MALALALGEVMGIFEWDELYNTGLETVDTEHMCLVDMINCLDEGFRTGSEDIVLLKLLDQLIDYTQYHFSKEEKMMADSKLSLGHYKEHKAAHDNFVAKIADARKACSEDTSNFSGEMMEFLVTWLIEHIDGTDKKMVALLQQSQNPVPVDGNEEAAEPVLTNSGQRATSNLIAALRESEERFRDLANSVPALIWMSSPDQQRQYSNERWQKFTGLDLEGMRAGWREHLHPDDCAQIETRLAAAHEERAGSKLEYRLRDAHGNYRWINEYVSPRYLKDGEFLGLVGCGFDVTIEKKAKAVVEQANEKLEMQVAKRTQKLAAALEQLNDRNTELKSANEELRVAQNNLVQAEKMKSVGQLAAGIAHEINTPSQYVADNMRFLQKSYDKIGELIDKLQGLGSNTDATITGDDIQQALKGANIEFLQREIPRAIEQSLDGVNHVTKIVGALKDFSRPNQKKANVALNEAIESTVTVAINEWTNVAEMELDLDPNLPEVFCLRTEFNQVILNMVVNATQAIAATLDGGAKSKDTIKVSTRHKDGFAVICITDTGCGMPEDVKAKIFEPFFTTRDVGEGMGQGLNIAHTVIVEKHGGTITVDSEPGHGSCFTIRLPLAESKSLDATAVA